MSISSAEIIEAVVANKSSLQKGTVFTPTSLELRLTFVYHTLKCLKCSLLTGCTEEKSKPNQSVVADNSIQMYKHGDFALVKKDVLLAYNQS